MKGMLGRDQAGPAAIVWRAVPEDLRETMTAGNDDRWLAPTAATRLAGRELTVAVPTDTHRYWLDVRLRWRIEEALRLLRYTEVRVRFIVGTDAPRGACAGNPVRRRERAHTGGRRLP